MYDSNFPTGISVVEANGAGLIAAPNPANNSTELTYTVTEGGNTDIRMFDMTGRQVALIAQGGHAAGTYRATLNTAELPEGVYTIRMENGNAITNRRIVITH
jgi:hypothetical protein